MVIEGIIFKKDTRKNFYFHTITKEYGRITFCDSFLRSGSGEFCLLLVELDVVQLSNYTVTQKGGFCSARILSYPPSVSLLCLGWYHLIAFIVDVVTFFSVSIEASFYFFLRDIFFNDSECKKKERMIILCIIDIVYIAGFNFEDYREIFEENIVESKLMTFFERLILFFPFDWQKKKAKKIISYILKMRKT